MPNVKISELLVGALIFGIILIIIIPLPPMLLDIYIAINLTLSVIAIGISLYISKPLDFSALPVLRLNVDFVDERKAALKELAAALPAFFSKEVISGF